MRYLEGECNMTKYLGGFKDMMNWNRLKVGGIFPIIVIAVTISVIIGLSTAGVLIGTLYWLICVIAAVLILSVVGIYVYIILRLKGHATNIIEYWEDLLRIILVVENMENIEGYGDKDFAKMDTVNQEDFRRAVTGIVRLLNKVYGWTMNEIYPWMDQRSRYKYNLFRHDLIQSVRKCSEISGNVLDDSETVREQLSKFIMSVKEDDLAVDFGSEVGK
jgi:hypothetical protein